MPTAARAAHPLITEDTGTQGAGHIQVELTHERGVEHDADGRQKIQASNAILALGVRSNLDLILSVPHRRARDSVGTESGIADLGFDLKWCFYEDGPVTAALKPGVTVPSGDEGRGLGAGRAGWSAYLVSTYDPEPWQVHLHLGVAGNDNVVGEREPLWHASLAGVWTVAGGHRLVVDLGIDTHPHPDTRRHQAFAIFGVIYSVTKAIEVNIGYKLGYNEFETSHALLAGLIVRH